MIPGGMTLAERLQAAIDAARSTRPVDCTCDGLHTDDVGEGVDLVALIALERHIGSCPAEVRALERIAARL